MTWTLIGPARRTSSCTTEPRSSSNQRERDDLPMTMWVTLFCCAKARMSSAMRAPPGSVSASAPSLSAVRNPSAMRFLSASLRRCVRGVSMLSAVQGAWSLSAVRLA
jgi:hypothetical protein